MYSVCTKYIHQDKSAYLRLNIHTFQVAYKPEYSVLVCTKYILVLLNVLHFSHFWRVHISNSVYVLTLANYILWVPDSIARLQGPLPASLLASDSGTGPVIEPNQTKALTGLFTAAWQHPCLHSCQWALVLLLAACWGISCCRSASPDLLPSWSAACLPAAPDPACYVGCAANLSVKDLGFKFASWWWAQNIQAILPSSEI